MLSYLVRITEQSQNRPAGLGIFLAIGIKQLTFFFADNQMVGNLYACKEINYGDIKTIKNLEEAGPGYPVYAGFIFLNLLENNADVTGQFFLA